MEMKTLPSAQADTITESLVRFVCDHDLKFENLVGFW